MKETNRTFDERQLQIRGDIFMHGCITTIAALLLNAGISSLDIFWANVFQQNILILVLIITVISIEFHMRGVYFGRGIPRMPILAVIGLCVLVMATFTIMHFAQGAAFAMDGQLTDEGFAVLICVMFALNIGCGIAALLRHLREENTREERGMADD